MARSRLEDAGGMSERLAFLYLLPTCCRLGADRELVETLFLPEPALPRWPLPSWAPSSLLIAALPHVSLLPWLLFPKSLQFVAPLVCAPCPSRSRAGMCLTHGPRWSPLEAISV